MSALRWYYSIAAVLVGAGALAGVYYAQLSWFVATVIASSIVVFLFAGVDKGIAGGTKTRIPERLLLLLAFFGGSPGLLAAMLFFRHKTQKKSFQLWFGAIVVVQVVLVRFLASDYLF